MALRLQTQERNWNMTFTTSRTRVCRLTRRSCLRRSRRFCLDAAEDRTASGTREERTHPCVRFAGILPAWHGDVTMNKLFTLLIILAIGVTTFAQSPTNQTRERRTTSESADQTSSEDKTAVDLAVPADAGDQSTDQPDKKSRSRKVSAKLPEVTAGAQTDRADESSEEAAI